jgi:hypothetical protein
MATAAGQKALPRNDTWLFTAKPTPSRCRTGPKCSPAKGSASPAGPTAGIARRAKDERGRLFIDGRDERGHVVDVHALRITFGTHLSKGGVPLRTAQAAMRHSRPDLTANVYTDPKLLDVAGALDALPLLPLDAEVVTQTAKATGTTGDVTIMAGVALQEPARPLVPTLVPNPGKPCTAVATGDKTTCSADEATGAQSISATACDSKTRTPLTIAVNGVQYRVGQYLAPKPA